MKPTPAEAFTEIVRLFALFAGHPSAHQEEQWPGVDAYIQHLATTGWTRKEIALLIHSLNASNTDFPSDKCLEAAGEYMSALTGHASPGCIVRLPGEPEDLEALTAHVRGGAWQKELAHEIGHSADEATDPLKFMLHQWSQVQGIDTDGPRILRDLQRLIRGELTDDEIGELLCDLVRDRCPSTAGYAAIPYLLGDYEAVSPSVRGQMLHAACLILGLAGTPPAPPVPQAFARHFTPEIKQQALQKLLRSASEEVLGEADLICITSAALLLTGRRDAYDYLIELL